MSPDEILELEIWSRYINYTLYTIYPTNTYTLYTHTLSSFSEEISKKTRGQIEDIVRSHATADEPKLISITNLQEVFEELNISQCTTLMFEPMKMLLNQEDTGLMECSSVVDYLVSRGVTAPQRMHFLESIFHAEVLEHKGSRYLPPDKGKLHIETFEG